MTFTKLLSPDARFWSKVDKTEECWNWKGNILCDGYGQFTVDENGNKARAHRFAYELSRGKIPNGLVIDHLCRNTRCVNPDHMEVVTIKENLMRGSSPSAMNARKTHCPNGHPLNWDNIKQRDFMRDGARRCLICSRARHRVAERERRLRLRNLPCG